MKKVAIVILNWNGKRDTMQCLESIEKLSIINYQLSIYVVDNGSKDGLVEELKVQSAKCKIIENKENLGYAEGNNVGIRAALEDEADYVMILNNDTVVDKNLAIQLIKTIEKYPVAGIVSPKIYFANGFEFHKSRYKKDELGKVIWYAGGLIDWKNVLLSHQGVDEVDKGQYNETSEIDYATGACLFVNKEVFNKIGFFDKNYFLYLEDADFCQRAKQAGFKIIYNPKAILWHKVAQSSGIGSSLNDYYITRNRLLFAARYANMRAKFALLRESIRLLFNGRKWQKRGVIDYYLGNLGKGSFNS
ncbi:glycosyltransferase family 2 protein [Candidatus Microgenomates bacterium]|nr:glycosyltransferase family 2 protein [Candidatus Microgenomates bacterium]